MKLTLQDKVQTIAGRYFAGNYNNEHTHHALQDKLKSLHLLDDQTNNIYEIERRMRKTIENELGLAEDNCNLFAGDILQASINFIDFHLLAIDEREQYTKDHASD